MEVAIAQFSSRSALNVWYFCPLAKGLGWGMIVLSWICTVYYQVIITWVLYYLGNSFQNPLPWATCDNEWNTEFCTSRSGMNMSYLNLTFVNASVGLNATNGSLSYDVTNVALVEGNASSLNITRRLMTPSEEFWQYNNLEMTDGIDNIGGLRWQLVLCHLAGWLVNILIVVKGVKSVGKVVYVTATVPYLFLIILLVRGCTLPGAATGIVYYLRPDFNRLLDFKVWAEACMQIFYSLGPAWGGIITMASYNKFHHNMYRDAVIVPLINCFTSFFAGFVTFSVVGFMADEAGLTVEDVITSGPGLAFIAYPEALAKLPFAPAWSVIFFIMLYTIGLDSQFTTFETVVSGLVDQFPNYLRGKKIHVLIGLGVVNVAIGLLFCTRAGVYYFQICDWYAGAFTVMTIGSLECIAVVYLYGGRRFLYDIQMMLGSRPCFGWIGLLGGVTPVSLLICLGYSMFNFVAPYYGDYTYPMWAILFGWTLTVISLLPVFGCAIHQIVITKGTIIQKLKHSIRPDDSWGPALEQHQKDYKYSKFYHQGSNDTTLVMKVLPNTPAEDPSNGKLLQ
ncbi:sodium- and chloride-dependent glycine transporter 1-like isoform X2 [Lineus longissimus]